MKTEILQGTEPRLYQIVGPLAMNPKIIAQNDGVAFKTSENHVYVVAIDDSGACIGFVPVQNKQQYGEVNNYYIKDRSDNVFKALIKAAMAYSKKQKIETLVIIAQRHDYASLRALDFEVEKEFVKYTKFKKTL